MGARVYCTTEWDVKYDNPPYKRPKIDFRYKREKTYYQQQKLGNNANVNTY